jgi:hypothetical protein
MYTASSTEENKGKSLLKLTFRDRTRPRKLDTCISSAGNLQQTQRYITSHVTHTYIQDARWRRWLRARRSRVRVRIRSLNVFDLPNPSSQLNQPLTNMSSRGVKRGRSVRQTTSPSSVSRLSGQCGNIGMSQPCRPVIVVALLCIHDIQEGFRGSKEYSETRYSGLRPES